METNKSKVKALGANPDHSALWQMWPHIPRLGSMPVGVRMTRKRSNYRPRAVIKDVMSWIKQGHEPLTADADNHMRIVTRIHGSVVALQGGTADVHDLNTLISASNMATGYKNIDLGRDYEQEIRTGAHAVAAVRERLVKWKKVQATATEVEAISLLVQICQAQLEASTRADFEKASAIVTRNGCEV